MFLCHGAPRRHIHSVRVVYFLSSQNLLVFFFDRGAALNEVYEFEAKS